jgi:ABC-2 type transport system permease protein
MNGYLKLVEVQAKLFLREPLALFFRIAFPAIMLVLFGTMWGNDIQPWISEEFGYIDLQVPALAGMILGTAALTGLPVQTAYYRERGIFRRFKATPMPSWQWIMAEITTNYVLALLGMGVMVGIGRIFFDMNFYGNWSLALTGFTLSALAFMAFGYLIASLAPTPRIATVVGQLVYIPMLMLSGTMTPTNVFPDGLKAFAEWLPMTHVVILMQDLWLRGEWPMPSAWMLLGLLLVCGVASARLFRWE